MPRRLGQHFLRPDSVEGLLRVIAPAAGDVFLEIGPGTGALTLPLAERCARVVAVEIDDALARRLRGGRPFERRDRDAGRPGARTCEASSLRAPAWSGNLPYYISSPLLRRFLSLHDHVRDLHVMLQEEVARRVASPPGSKEYGILSVLYALWADTDLPGPLSARLLLSASQGHVGRPARPVPRHPARRRGRHGRRSSDSSRRPSPAAAGPLKTT